ncbi:22308_t:CDS:1, partial [Gigaspora margarita]
QKDHLLDFGLNKLKLTPEQQEQLTIIHSDQFKTFTLTGSQKNILNSLSPLIREDKYSEESLQLFKSLNLKPQQQNFFVREEIIPDPNTQFGSVKSSYLPLKTKFLGGEQKVLRVKLKEQEQQERVELVQKKKNSILKSLLEFGCEVQKVNQNLQFAEKKLKKEIP